MLGSDKRHVVNIDGSESLFCQSGFNEQCSEQLEKAGEAFLFLAQLVRSNSNNLSPDDKQELVTNLVSSLSSLSTQKQQDVIGGIDLAKQITGKSASTIYHLVSQGKLPASKAGGKLYFSSRALTDYISQKRQRSDPS